MSAVLRPQVPGASLPVPSVLAAPYWEGCKRGELRFQRCTACAAIPRLPATRCPRCLSSGLEWERSAGCGILYSWTVVWRPQHPAFSVPYAPAIVRLDEGFDLLSAVVGCSPDDLEAELRLEVEFHAASDEITLPFFHPLRAP